MCLINSTLPRLIVPQYLSILMLVVATGMAVRHPTPSIQRGSLHWVTGYWHGPRTVGELPAAEIEYSALTHVVHYALIPNSDGSFEPKSLQAVTKYAHELISTAHQNRVRVLLGVTQTTYGGDYAGATRPSVMPRFIANILRIVDQYGYDGVDIDWEPNIEPASFIAFVPALRKALDAQSPKLELTGAFWEAPWYLIRVQDAFDQINIMAYDNCGPSDGFSWYNAALYNTGVRMRRTVDWRVRQFTSVIPSRKLGLGIPFYGYVWSGGTGTSTGGVSRPGQRWRSPPAMHPMDYREILTDPTLWHARYQRRDEAAGNVPFLSIERHDSQKDVFVTYDDEISVSRKVLYAKAHSLGGIMIYELSGDYLPDQPRPHPLLDAVQDAAGPLLDPQRILKTAVASR